MKCCENNRHSIKILWFAWQATVTVSSVYCTVIVYSAEADPDRVFLITPHCQHHESLQHRRDAPSHMLAYLILSFLLSIDILHLTLAILSHTSRACHSNACHTLTCSTGLRFWVSFDGIKTCSTASLFSSVHSSLITSSLSGLDSRPQRFNPTIAAH